MTHPESHLPLSSRQVYKTAQTFAKVTLGGGIAIINPFALLLITWKVLLTGYPDILRILPQSKINFHYSQMYVFFLTYTQAK